MKYVITVAVLALSFQSFGQFAKGDMELGGTFSLSARGKSTEAQNSSIGVSPNFGVFLSSNLETGVQLSFSRYYLMSQGGPWKYENYRRNLEAGLYLRKYFTLSDKFFFTVSGSVTYGHGTEWYKTTSTADNQVDESKSDNNNAELAVTPRFIFLPSEHWALQFGLGNINYTFTKYKNGNKENYLQLSYGYADVGIVYYIRRAG